MQIYKNKTQISKSQNIILHHFQGGGNSLIIYNLRKKKDKKNDIAVFGNVIYS